MAVRPKFDPSRDFVAARGFTFAGTEHQRDTPFDKAKATSQRLAMLYDSRMIDFAPDSPAGPVDPVKVTKVSAGYFDVSAPWLDEPIRARGRAKADEAAEKVRADGPPLGWIDGGTLITVEGGDGGWYEVNSPWLDEPEKVQGRDAAEARQRELHDAGEPATYRGYTLTAGENGWFGIARDGSADELKVHGEDAAREAVAALRRGEPVEGQPADWAAPTDPVTVDLGAVGTEAQGQFVVAAPWLDAPEIIETEDAANARADELRAAGPPEGWVPADAE